MIKPRRDVARQFWATTHKANPRNGCIGSVWRMAQQRARSVGVENNRLCHKISIACAARACLVVGLPPTDFKIQISCMPLASELSKSCFTPTSGSSSDRSPDALSASPQMHAIVRSSSFVQQYSGEPSVLDKETRSEMPAFLQSASTKHFMKSADTHVSPKNRFWGQVGGKGFHAAIIVSTIHHVQFFAGSFDTVYLTARAMPRPPAWLA